jgi:alanine dehydrogenase
MPGAVPYTSTFALTNATLPYALALANLGWKRAAAADPALLRGLNIVEGRFTLAPLAEQFHVPYHDPEPLVA